MPGGVWRYVPSCPCDTCENYRKANGMSCMFGLGPRPEQERRHHQHSQAVPEGTLEKPWTRDEPVG